MSCRRNRRGAATALAEVADETIRAVQTIPVYSRPLEGEFGDSVRAGVHGAFGHLLAGDRGGRERAAARRVQPARARRDARRPVTSLLLSAYRIGARVAGGVFAGGGGGPRRAEAGHCMYLLAESIFAYIDVLSSESAAGYALEQLAVTSETSSGAGAWRGMLIREPALDPGVIERAARDAAGRCRACWRLLRSRAASAGSGAGGVGVGGTWAAAAPQRDAPASGSARLCARSCRTRRAPGWRAESKRSVLGAKVRAGLGPRCRGRRRPSKASRARRPRLRLRRPRLELVAAEQRAGELLLRTESAARGRARSPGRWRRSTRCPPARARDCARRLAVWLAEQGRLGPTAARLGVHTQTARYRVNRLRRAVRAPRSTIPTSASGSTWRYASMPVDRRGWLISDAETACGARSGVDDGAWSLPDPFCST